MKGKAIVLASAVLIVACAEHQYVKSNQTYRMGQEADKSYRYFDMGNYMGMLGDKVIKVCYTNELLMIEKERGLTYFTKSGLKQDDNPAVFIYTLK